MGPGEGLNIGKQNKTIGTGGAKFIFQPDGNLVLYSAAGQPRGLGHKQERHRLAHHAEGR